MVGVRVLTLNCWGILYISKHRASRFQHIAEHIAAGSHDLVALQEVWCKQDYHYVKEHISSVLPYSQYFSSGVIGSGLCMFSRWPIEEIAYEPFQLHGIPYKVWEGDWFGGKGVAMCVILHPRHGPLHFFTTHMVAEYSHGKINSNQSCRISQAFQVVRFIRRYKPRFAIVSGDFNAQPESPSYNLLTSYGQLTDSWLTVGGSDVGPTAGHTCNLPDNVYTEKQSRAKRIDYIFYSSDNMQPVKLQCQSCVVMLEQVPHAKLCYSDHSGVAADFEFIQIENGDCSEDEKAVKAPMDTLIVAEQLTSMGIQTAHNRRQQQMVGFLFFISMWFTLIAFSWLPVILSVISFNPVNVGLTSPLVGILQSIAAALATLFALFGFIVTQIEIYKMNQLHQEIKLLCDIHVNSQK